MTTAAIKDPSDSLDLSSANQNFGSDSLLQITDNILLHALAGASFFPGTQCRGMFFWTAYYFYCMSKLDMAIPQETSWWARVSAQPATDL